MHGGCFTINRNKSDIWKYIFLKFTFFAIAYMLTKKIIELIKPYRTIIIFLFKCIGLYFLWLILKIYIFYPYGLVDKFLIHQITHSTSFLLKFLGFETYVADTYVGISKHPGVSIAFNCNGLSLMYLFAAFIIAFSGNWKYKLLFIPIGIFIIHLFNILRTALLAIIVVYKPSWTEFNHKYSFTATVYIVIFILWVVWVNYFSLNKSDNFES